MCVCVSMCVRACVRVHVCACAHEPVWEGEEGGYIHHRKKERLAREHFGFGSVSEATDSAAGRQMATIT